MILIDVLPPKDPDPQHSLKSFSNPIAAFVQNPFLARALPHIIGSVDWNEDDRVGLKLEDDIGKIMLSLNYSVQCF